MLKYYVKASEAVRRLCTGQGRRGVARVRRRRGLCLRRSHRRV